jgi:superfamily I DNA and/or RNA helicase
MINDRDFKEVLIEEAEDEKLANEIGHNYLKESQFKRLIVNPKVSTTIRATFDVQYRMHSQIGALIQQFYPELENGLVCGIKAEEDVEDLNNKASRYHGLFHEGFIKPQNHVIWVDVPEPEAKDGTSRVNEKEVETVKQVLNYLKNSDGYEAFQNHWEKEKDTDKRLQEQEIGIISFYGKQVRKLNEVRKYAQKELDMKIRLKTVDKFQGMERNIIIVSTVRSDKIIDLGTGEAVPNVRGREGRNYSPWGFADSPERLNVALSRARRLLIVAGNRRHFAHFKNKEGVAIYENVINQIPPENIIDYRMLNKYQ